MGTITTADETATTGGPVRCPICAYPNEPRRMCRHVRWTFEQGGPIDFAKFALETSPYVQARGHASGEIPRRWWEEHGDFVVDQVLLHFDASDGFVFGELKDVDLLARDIWREYHPETERAEMQRVDPV